MKTAPRVNFKNDFMIKSIKQLFRPKHKFNIAESRYVSVNVVVKYLHNLQELIVIQKSWRHFALHLDLIHLFH